MIGGSSVIAEPDMGDLTARLHSACQSDRPGVGVNIIEQLSRDATDRVSTTALSRPPVAGSARRWRTAILPVINHRHALLAVCIETPLATSVPGWVMEWNRIGRSHVYL
jgi:hypothetical protein